MLAMNLGPTELLVIMVIGIIPLAIVVWGVVDAAGRPTPAWEAAGQNKTLWIVLPVLGGFMCWIGAILAIIYLATIRPKVAAAQQGGLAFAVPPSYPAQGAWAADPTGRHQMRWWDGARWTEQVSDNGVPSTDPMG